jgi:DNA-damage-inducible protein D
MKKELIEQLFASFEDIKQEHASVEYWSARSLQDLLGYSKWENFEKIIVRAKGAAENSSNDINDHFLKVRKMIGNW